MRVRAVLAGGLLIVLAVLAVVLSQREPRMAGSNLVPELGYLPPVPGGKRICQADELIPEHTANVRLLVGTFGRPGGGLEVKVTRAGRPVTSGSLGPGHGQGHLTVPVSPVRSTVSRATICVTNGDRKPVALAGSDRIPPPARIDGRDQPGRVRVEYLRQGRESWWSILGLVVHRFGYGKADLFGSWTLFAALAATLAALAAGAVALLREDGA